jgi:beta-N-acetylhexosaminidase
MAADPQALSRRRRDRARAVTHRRRAAVLAAMALVAAVSFVLGSMTGGAGGDEAASGEPAEPFALDPLPQLDPEQLAGQRLIAGFEGTTPPRGLIRAIGDGRLAGVVIFEDNVAGTDALGRLVARLQAVPRPTGLEAPLAVMVDQEGGLVKRLDGPPSVSAAQMGGRGTAFASEQGAATAQLLREAGINVDLAPVLDIARPGSAMEAEGRSFGDTAAQVTEVGVGGFAAGLDDGGVVAAAKHFPGFGAARVNTDQAAQRIDLSRRTLRVTDQAPFQAFADDGGEVIMLSLASYRAFGDRPAAFDRAIATGELRDRLGFGGVTVTDSLDAAAAMSFGNRGRVAVAAAGAGSDLLLYGSWRTALCAGSALSDALTRGELDEAEFGAAARRVLSLRAELAG